MDDAEGGLSFDFEGGLDVGLAAPTASMPVINSDPSAANNNNNPVAQGAAPALTNDSPAVSGGGAGRRSFRQTVCRHWLRSLCMKGDACGFLHQYDKSRMPVCRFFRLSGECREQDCVYKHTNEDIKECNMYKLGFCPNGSDCRYRHAKLPGPPPSVEEVLQKIQQLTSYNYNNKFFQQRNAGFSQQTEKSQIPQGQSNVNQGAIGKPSTTESANVQQQFQQPQQQVSQTQIQNVPHSQSNQTNRSAIPLPQGISRYFIVKSCNRENLELSVQQGVWATQRSNEAKLNEAFDSAENVILIFSVNRTRHFQGCAKMTSKIGGSVGGGNWKYAHGTAHYGRNFPVKWLKISRDCQELEPSVGEQLASMLYLEPDSELMAISLAAESKREEEKAKGVNSDIGGENPDIVPFEDNEEEEEEESEEEDESFGAVDQGRGRGRGMMWPPHMPLGRGARPMPGMRGFPPMMMGGDGFSYGPVAPDGFGMPDLFGAPRPFAPYGPRFSASGMMFPGRPPQPGPMFPGGGLGMMMGPGHAPFMGGMGPTGANPPRGGRPVGMHPTFPGLPAPSSQNSGRGIKRDQRTPTNDRYSAGSDQGRGQDMTGPGGGLDDETRYQHEVQKADSLAAGNSFRNDDSESEDEAPRRSRHGKGRRNEEA
ncbi:30-kDa cleavage and polyadenylation specificity factor 30-like isoform X2 [Hibiscus syriacus]|uniref:30-kDa cleavage and polyadenylation specificity factor 30-like isoform X2 n=1 Tax=Hibiscus syriacus TaxID=106335 RepID=UPI001922A7BD|nr:30-kDa cleavage and polyadenylation specificity factor 30-like isoform X2 [Hibiscus syriacus]